MFYQCHLAEGLDINNQCVIDQFHNKNVIRLFIKGSYHSHILMSREAVRIHNAALYTAAQTDNIPLSMDVIGSHVLFVVINQCRDLFHRRVMCPLISQGEVGVGSWCVGGACPTSSLSINTQQQTQFKLLFLLFEMFLLAKLWKCCQACQREWINLHG